MKRSTVAWWTVALLSVGALVPADRRLPPPCQEEDGGPYPCLWDGPSRGNHHGARVVILTPP